MFAELIDRCATIKPGTMLGEHPAFGNLSYDEYGALIAKHTDHHLRQFGRARRSNDEGAERTSAHDVAAKSSDLPCTTRSSASSVSKIG